LTAQELENIEKFHRYLDVDGDGIPYRTLPGEHPKGAYFTRGSGHNKFGLYTEDAAEYQDVLDRIARKIEGASKAVPRPEIRLAGKTSTPPSPSGPGRASGRIGLVTVGGCHAACLEALERLQEKEIEVDYMRVRGFPFADEVKEFLEAHDTNFVVEQNRDGQLRSLLQLETQVDPGRLRSILSYSGFPMSAQVVLDGVQEHSAVPA
jgi:2-oxoglutarate/2-oxoacid ferredoxin oxidoreductase subunit alpha